MTSLFTSTLAGARAVAGAILLNERNNSMPDQPPSTTEKVKQDIKKEIDKIPPTTDQNLMAAISYVWIISLVMLVVRRDNEFIQHHAKQGLVLFLLTLLWWIPIIGWILGALAVAGMVIGFINAWQGREFKIPYVYGWSQKLRL